jgi:WD40 repeat protein
MQISSKPSNQGFSRGTREMVVAKKESVLFGGALKHSAAAWRERLGKPDAAQLDSLIDLAAKEQTPLDQILGRLFPDKEPAKALVAFSSLRKRLNDASMGLAFDLPDLGLRLVVDSRKRDEPKDRTCWFTGPNMRSEAAAEMSRLSVQDISSHQFERSKASVTSTDALQKGKRTVRFFVSYSRAVEEARLAEDLLSRLRTEFGASARYAVNLWQDTHHIDVDKQWHAEIQKAIDECDFGFLLLSPAFLNSKYIREDELPAFISPEGSPGRKPLIAVGLAKLDFQDHDLRGLEEQQIFRWAKTTGAHEKFYSDLRINGDKRLFAQSLFIKCQKALDRRFQSPQDAQSNVLAGTVLSRRKRTPNTNNQPLPPISSPIEVDIDDKLDPADIPGDVARNFIDQARLGQDPERLKHFEKPLAATNPGSQPIDALAYLNDWLGSENAPPILYVLGDYGIGKTTTLKQLTHDLLERRKTDSSIPVPLFVDLRHYLFERKQHVPTSIQELLTAVIARNWRLPGPPALGADDILQMVRDERALLIFDGLDEKTVHMTPSEARAFIRVLWQALPETGHQARSKKRTQEVDAKPTGRLIISCRSHYFRDVPAETSMLTGEHREEIDRANTPVLTLLPFNESQIRNYLTGILDGDADRAESAIQLIGSIHNMSELATRPYLLSMIAERLEEFDGARQRGETVNAARLYQMFTQRWLSRDDGKHSLDPLHKRILMQQLAADLWRESEREMSPDQLDLWLDRFLKEHAYIGQAYASTDRSILKEDLRTACFVLRDDQRVDNQDTGSPADVRSSFRFAHSSLQEFFLAAWLWNGLSDGNIEAFELPMVSIETLDFLGQLLQLDSERQRGKSLSQLAKVLEGNHVGAATLAFRYWLRAIERRMPLPKPTKVNLAQANLEEWTIRGRGPSDRFDLRAACFHGAQLHRARLEWVDLSGADMSQVGLCQAVLIDVKADGSQWTGADLSGAQWRIGSLRGVDLSQACLDCEMIHVDTESDTQSVLIHRPSDIPSQAEGPYVLGGHSGSVSCCSWSPDGRVILSASHDDTLKLWDPKTGRCIRTLSGHSDVVNSCAWSPDGLQILSASADETLKLWDPSTGDCIRTLSGHSRTVSSCAWSPDGRQILSASGDKALKLWDPSTGDCIRTLSGHSASANSCAWSPDGRQILSASDDKTLKLWDPSTGDCNRTLSVHSSSVVSCAWSPDGRQILSGSLDNTLKLWDPSTGQCVRILSGESSGFRFCVWSPDGSHILSASWHNTLKLWDPSTGQCVRILSEKSNGIRSCVWSPDGSLILTASGDDTLKIWHPSTGQCIRTLSGHSGWIMSCAWSPDGRQILSTSWDKKLKLWDPNTALCTKTLSGHSGWIMSCGWSPDGRQIVSASSDKTIKIWDPEMGDCIRTLSGHSDRARSCDWSPDGSQILSASFDKTLKIWDPETGQCMRTLSGHSGPVLSCDWSPDGSQILSASFDKTLKIWDPETGQCMRTLSGHSGWVRSCAWSPDGRQILSGSSDNTLKLWDPNTGQCTGTLTGHTNYVMSCSWSPDGRQILSGSWDNTFKLWDASTGRCLRTFHLLPENQWATILEPGALPDDSVRGSVQCASPEAWRWLGWLVHDRPNAIPRFASIEAFGPIPGLEVPGRGS